MKMSKEYLEQQYRLSVLTYRSALTEEEQWRERATMARLERIAAEDHGFDYADSLHRLCASLAV